jgi:iron complex transport system ATP-binding protein
MRDVLLRLDGVHAGYRTADGDRAVLKGVDLEVHPGETLALLGANGSGKTTLLGVMAGTISASRGTVELLGEPIGSRSRVEVARRVAVLPQSAELPSGFRVAEVVAMGRTPHGTDRWGWGDGDRRAVGDALRDADAVDLADRPVGELSGGERQRVLVALALAQEPSLLLLDEPTSHLDVAHATSLLAALSRLQRVRGVTIVAVLHDLVLAATWAPRVAVLGAGRIVADGPPAATLGPEVVRQAFGVTMDAAITESGGRVLVPRLPPGA